MSEWITPDEVKEHFDNGYKAGKRETETRIIKLLKSNLKLAKSNAGFSLDMARTESYLHGLEQSIALIKGGTE